MDIEKRVEKLENTLAGVVKCQVTLAFQIGAIAKMLEEIRDYFEE